MDFSGLRKLFTVCMSINILASRHLNSRGINSNNTRRRYGAISFACTLHSVTITRRQYPKKRYMLQNNDDQCENYCLHVNDQVPEADSVACPDLQTKVQGALSR